MELRDQSEYLTELERLIDLECLQNVAPLRMFLKILSAFDLVAFKKMHLNSIALLCIRLTNIGCTVFIPPPTVVAGGIIFYC